jgi:hypothetical protein
MTATTKADIERNLEANLKVLRLIYVVSYTLGYARLSLLFPHDLDTWPPQSAALIIFAAVVLFVLSVRFYWAVGTLRRYMLEKLRRAEHTKLKETLKWPFRRMMFIHVPVLMAHSFMFFLLCRYLEDIAKHLQEAGDQAPPLTRFALLYCGLLALNAVWLRMLKTDGKASEEQFWMRNNAAFAIIGTIWVLAGPCLVVNNQVVFAIALCLFLANSAFDFWKCCEAYTSESPE